MKPKKETMNALQRNARMLFARMGGALAAPLYLGTCLLALCSAPESASAVELPSPGDSVQVAAPAELPEAPGVAGRGAAPDLSPSPANTPEQLSAAFRNKRQGAALPGGAARKADLAGSTEEPAPESKDAPRFAVWGLYALTGGFVMALLGYSAGMLSLGYLGLGLMGIGLLLLAFAAVKALAREFKRSKRAPGNERDPDEPLADKKTRRRLLWRKIALIMVIVSLPLILVDAGLALLSLVAGLLILLFNPNPQTPENAPDKNESAPSGPDDAQAAKKRDSGRPARLATGYIALFVLVVVVSGLLAALFVGPLAFGGDGMGIVAAIGGLFLLLVIAAILGLAGAAVSALEN